MLLKKQLRAIVFSSFLLIIPIIVQAQWVLPIDDHGPSGALLRYTSVDINVAAIETMAGEAVEWAPSAKGVEIPLYYSDGGEEIFRFYSEPLMESELAAKYSMIKMLKGYSLERPWVHARLNVGPQSAFYMIHDIENGDQYLKRQWVGGQLVHRLIHATDETNGFSCEVDNDKIEIEERTGEYKVNNCFTNGTDFRTYRVAIATTGEFWDLNGANSTDVMNALTDRLAAVAIPYEDDAATTFDIIADNEDVMYQNENTDPFTDPTNTSVSLNETRTAISDAFSFTEYDIGHGYHEITCGGSCGWAGRAAVGVVCDDSGSDAFEDRKAGAYTYQPNDIASNVVWMHEYGHQFGCRHTNYGCGSSGCQRYEPGRGLTIMSTSAGCDGDDFVASRQTFFNAGALDQIIGFIQNGLEDNGSCVKQDFGDGDCATISSTANTAIPVSDANPNSVFTTIPIGTPFMLTGSGSDGNGDVLTYSWEHFDADNSNTADPDATENSTTAPLFRVFPASADATRYFPLLNSILVGDTEDTGEILPQVGRTMDMRLIVRDNNAAGGGIACDEITITVDGGSGPFEIISQNAPTAWIDGATETITWSVNNTDNAPINANNVEILFSDDGGQTFGTVLVASTPNDGGFDITVPSIVTTQGRIRINPLGANYIFFDINNADIEITAGCPADAESIYPRDVVTEEEANPALNLNMRYGTLVSSFDGTLTTSDDVGNSVFDDNGGTCRSSNSNNSDQYSFYVTSSGNYTFNLSGLFGQVMNLYQGSPSGECDGWLASSATRPSGSGAVSLSNSVSASFNTDQLYTIVVETFSTNPSYYGNYNVTPSGPGSVYDEPQTVGGYNYSYVTVDGADIITDIESTPDLREENAGMYEVYGLHYQSSVNIQNYVGGGISQLTQDINSGVICADISSQNRDVNINTSTAAVATRNNAACISASKRVDGNDFIRFFDDLGNIIAAINPNNQNLGNVNIEFSDLPTVVQTTTGSNYFPRSWVIQSENSFGSAATVRLYALDQELTAYGNSDGMSYGLNDLSINWFDHVNDASENCDYDDNVATGNTIGEEPQTSFNYDEDGQQGFYLEFDIDHFTEFTFGAQQLLPVELIHFTADYQDSEVLLQWQTVTEINSASFAIEHSVDAERWQTIHEQPAAGNSSSLIQYEAKHKTPVSGANYYRLKQVDLDRAEYRSQIVRIDISYGEYSVFPNPARDLLNVVVENAHVDFAAHEVTLQLRSLTGAVVLERQYDLSSVNGLMQLDLADGVVAQGAYVVVLQHSEGSKVIDKVIINR